MNKIKTIPYTQITNGNASRTYDLLLQAYERLKQIQLPKTADAELESEERKMLKEVIRLIVCPKIIAFAEQNKEFDKYFRQPVASAFTRQLNRNDRDRDRNLNLANRAIVSGLKSTKPKIAKAALHISVVFSRFKNLPNRQRSEQTELTEVLLRQLATPEMQVHVKLIPGLEAILENIRELNETFSADTDERTSEREKIVKGFTIKARRRTDAIALEVATTINLVASLYDDPVLNEVVNSANTILNEARIDLINRRRGRSVSLRHKKQQEENGSQTEE